MFLFRWISRLPLGLLYLFTDLVYLLGYYVIGYRKKVIFNNLSHAFPEKTKEEIEKIAKKFFRNLTDSFAETIKIYGMDKVQLAEMFKLQNAEIFIQLMDQKHIPLVISGHFFHWEGQVTAFNGLIAPKLETIYTKINQPLFNQLMKEIRGKFGGTLVEKKDFPKNYLRERKTIRAIGLAADQRPGMAENRYWTQFMNRKTAIYEGPEKLALRNHHPIVYSHASKLGRGKYHFEYELIYMPPYDHITQHEITERFVRITEDDIKKDPALYLWSHNRWRDSV